MSAFAQPPEWAFTSVDLGANVTTITTGAAILHGITVTSVLSAHVMLVLDGAGGDRVHALPASTAAGTSRDGLDVLCPNGIVVDPDDAMTGTIALAWKASHDGLAGPGAS